jgi:hypothetical protein
MQPVSISYNEGPVSSFACNIIQNVASQQDTASIIANCEKISGIAQTIYRYLLMCVGDEMLCISCVSASYQLCIPYIVVWYTLRWRLTHNSQGISMFEIIPMLRN